MISPEIIQEIKYRNDIESVVSQYVNLRPSGSNMFGLCPFHSEKSPSFSVSKSREMFHCFGCGAGGDVITFIMKIENLDYVGALEFLAKRAGITIPQDYEKNKNAVPSHRILEINKTAAKYYNTLLFSPQGKAGLDYLLNERKLPKGLIMHFGMGFAPDSWDSLTVYLKKEGFSEKEITTAFLGFTGKKGNVLDIFRNRVMVPIIDVKGDVVGFTGRRIDGQKDRKYLNTNDTPVFKKSRQIFALNFARNFCSEQLILCEGQMDVISLHGAGFSNAVATSGTALTREQARIMSRYTKKVVIAYDSDSAGQAASDRAFGILSEVGLEVRVITMEGAKDPDEYLHKFGKDRFSDLINGGKTQFDFRFDGILKKYDIRMPEQKIKAAEEIKHFISTLSSAVEREVYIGKVCEKLEIDKSNLTRDVEKEIRLRSSQTKKDERNKVISETAGLGDRINPDRVKNIRAASAEESIIGIMLTYPELLKKISDGQTGLQSDDFFTAFGKKVFDETLALYSQTDAFDVGMLGQTLSPDEMGRVTELIYRRNTLSSNGEKELLDCIKVLKTEKQGGQLDIKQLIEQKRKQLNDFS